MTTLVWFRDDLRISDNPALHASADDPSGVVALYVLDEQSEHVRALGGAAKWWLHHSLALLERSLADLGITLVLRRGAVEDVVPAVVAECGVGRVVWNRRYGSARLHDARIKASLREAGIRVDSYPGDLLFEPWVVLKNNGEPYRVYSAFWRACAERGEPNRPLPAPSGVSGAAVKVGSDSLESWNLLPTSPNWSHGIAKRWQVGEEVAQRKLQAFLKDRVANYSRRDFPAQDVGSELSPYLRWGQISPRQVWYGSITSEGDVGLFLSELGWREFAWHTAYHFGPLHKNTFNPRFDGFPWRDKDDEGFVAWCEGKTGFGIVDAGMAELWNTGFMHNRVRMITASLLTKNLQLDWRLGESWFWDTLVDADEASNPFNWQWVAGCGADAAPYFRIFNPELQQKKFDPNGAYVERWAPESVNLPKIVNLKTSRAQALDAYRALRS